MLNGPLREVDSELEWLCTDWTPEKKKCIALAGQLLDSAHQRGRWRGARGVLIEKRRFRKGTSRRIVNESLSLWSGKGHSHEGAFACSKQAACSNFCN